LLIHSSLGSALPDPAADEYSVDKFTFPAEVPEATKFPAEVPEATKFPAEVPEATKFPAEVPEATKFPAVWLIAWASMALTSGK
jgi:hypothetical protein